MTTAYEQSIFDMLDSLQTEKTPAFHFKGGHKRGIKRNGTVFGCIYNSKEYEYRVQTWDFIFGHHLDFNTIYLQEYESIVYLDFTELMKNGEMCTIILPSSLRVLVVDHDINVQYSFPSKQKHTTVVYIINNYYDTLKQEKGTIFNINSVDNIVVETNLFRLNVQDKDKSYLTKWIHIGKDVQINHLYFDQKITNNTIVDINGQINKYESGVKEQDKMFLQQIMSIVDNLQLSNPGNDDIILSKSYNSIVFGSLNINNLIIKNVSIGNLLLYASKIKCVTMCGNIKPLLQIHISNIQYLPLSLVDKLSVMESDIQNLVSSGEKYNHDQLNEKFQKQIPKIIYSQQTLKVLFKKYRKNSKLFKRQQITNKQMKSYK